MPLHKNRLAFTLIELLVVVGIISILSAIAIPNFMEAQTRAKIAKVQSDLRTCEMALQAYRIDCNKYPILRRSPSGNVESWNCGGATGNLSLYPCLTTPIAYISSFEGLLDPFAKSKRRLNTDKVCEKFGLPLTYLYAKSGTRNHAATPAERRARNGNYFVLWSLGPSGKAYNSSQDEDGWVHTFLCEDQWEIIDERHYDPSNGTASKGYVMRTQR